MKSKSKSKLSRTEISGGVWGINGAFFPVWFLLDTHATVKGELKALFDAIKTMTCGEAVRYLAANPPSPETVLNLMLVAAEDASTSTLRHAGKRAADARHSGNREKPAKLRAIWASGKYTSRDICAEEECAALRMAFSTARRALRNTPAPGT